MQILDALGLSVDLESVVGGDGPHGRKPDPTGLRALAHDDRDVILVGDSPIDWATARAAGCAFAWARYGFSAARFEDAPPETPLPLHQPTDPIEVLDSLRRFAPARDPQSGDGAVWRYRTSHVTTAVRPPLSLNHERNSCTRSNSMR